MTRLLNSSFVQRHAILRSRKLPDMIGMALLLMATLIVVLLTISREQAFHQKHLVIADQTTDSLSHNIENALQNQLWVTRVFLLNNQELIGQLIDNPEDEALFDDINQRLGRYFIDYYTFNIIGPEGSLVAEDFDGMLGEVCLVDIHRFVASNKSAIRLHTHPRRYHYDISHSLQYGGTDYTLLVSFDFGNIARLIRDTQPHNHQTVLAIKDRDYLIEVVANGARNVLRDRNDYRMTADERKRILSENAIAGTAWHAVDLHQEHLFVDKQLMIRLENATIYAAMLLVITMIWNALRSHHAHMEHEKNLLSHHNKVIHSQKEALLEHSITDELTGLRNRRYFNEAGKMKWDMAQRSQIPLSMLMIDIDNFKSYNDTYGHPMGDECLRKVAKLMLQAYGRSDDVVSRYGGEEFAIITTKSNFSESLQQAEKLCELVRRYRIENKNSDVKPWVTISVGLVNITPNPSITLQELLSRADNALYEAKRTGKDRVVAYDYTGKQQIRASDT